MIIGESEKILGNFMGICLFVLGGCVLDFYTAVLYLGFLNLSFISSYGHLAAPSPAAGKALCIIFFFFLLGFILSFNFGLLQALHADCTAQFGFFLGGSWIQP